MGQRPHVPPEGQSKILIGWSALIAESKHYLVYILAIKLWLQKGKMTFRYRMAMIFFRLQRKLVKIKFFLENCKTGSFLHMQLKTTSLLNALVEPLDWGSWHCTGDRDQDHPHGKEMQKSKMAVWGGLTNSCEKKRSEKQWRKEKI